MVHMKRSVVKRELRNAERLLGVLPPSLREEALEAYRAWLLRHSYSDLAGWVCHLRREAVRGRRPTPTALFETAAEALEHIGGRLDRTELNEAKAATREVVAYRSARGRPPLEVC